MQIHAKQETFTTNTADESDVSILVTCLHVFLHEVELLERIRWHSAGTLVWSHCIRQGYRSPTKRRVWGSELPDRSDAYYQITLSLVHIVCHRAFANSVYYFQKASGSC